MIYVPLEKSGQSDKYYCRILAQSGELCMSSLPTGTVTFFFTDIEGSTNSGGTIICIVLIDSGTIIQTVPI